MVRLPFVSNRRYIGLQTRPESNRLGKAVGVQSQPRKGRWPLVTEGKIGVHRCLAAPAPPRMSRVGKRRDKDAQLLPELNAIQRRFGFLPEEEVRGLSRRTLTPLYRLEGLISFFPHLRRQPPSVREVRVCTDIACHLRDPSALSAAQGAASPGTRVSACSCLGQCDRPVAALLDGELVTGLTSGGAVQLAQNGIASPAAPLPPPGVCRIDPYDRGRRYEALGRVINGISPGDPVPIGGVPSGTAVIQSLANSGLRGMGGAGFPPAAKWDLVRQAEADEKFVICNADESEPGTFKDRFLLDHFPDLVIEGMAIAAAVVGARRAYVFIRHEYGRQRRAVEAAIDRFKTGPHGGIVQLEVFESPGGYICGEETALLEAMEGKRAEPRNKPPFPGVYGLWGKPTVINNVETLAWVPAILLRGAEWFARQGVNGAKGLKFIALSGHVSQPGVYEVPLGIRAIDLIEQHGKGLTEGRSLKAFSPGGPSSGFLPAKMADVALDFQSLQRVGSMLGSGAVVAVGSGTCMLDAALNLLRFFRNESCGKCVPCRVGTEKMVHLAEQWARGSAAENDVGAVDDLATAMSLASICGLGQAAPLPLVSVLKYFPDEIQAHRRGRCPERARHG